MDEETQKTPGAATASLVLGLISLLCIGIILGIKGNKIQQTGMGTAGIVLSIIGLVLSIIVFFACVLCVGGLIALDAATSY